MRLSLPPKMFKDFIDLRVLKDAQPGFSSQGVVHIRVKALVSCCPFVGWLSGELDPLACDNIFEHNAEILITIPQYSRVICVMLHHNIGSRFTD